MTANELDELIFSNEKLKFIKAIQSENFPIAQATRTLSNRYKTLKTKYPEKRTISDEEYWGDFHA